MKIVVWNCRMAFARKCHALYDLRPDIAVIPECSKSDLELSFYGHFDGRWFGDNPRKGLGVLVAKPLRIVRAEQPPNRWVVPLSISGGASDFRLIAVWAMPVKGSVVRSYIGQVYEAIANHPQWFDSKPSVLCGDFNSNKIWDGRRETGNHSAVVDVLEKRGLLSAYHHFFSEPQGQETRPTYYFWHRKSRGYHIDYVFLPRAWASCIQSVAVGHHAEWSLLSDHVPLSVDLTAIHRHRDWVRDDTWRKWRIAGGECAYTGKRGSGCCPESAIKLRFRESDGLHRSSKIGPPH